MKTVVIVSTPLQLINSVEYIKEKNLSACWLLVLTTSRRKEEMIKNILQKQDFSDGFYSILYFPLYEMNRARELLCSLYFRLFIKHQLPQDVYRCIMSGYYNVFHRYLLYKCNDYNNACLNVCVDDGTAAYTFAKIRNEEVNNNCSYFKKAQRVLEKYAFAFSGISIFFPARVDFYSVFDLKLPPGDNLERISYKYLKAHFKSIFPERDYSTFDCVFLGQSLPRILSVDVYISYLKAFANLESDKKIMYIPHPDEKYKDYENRLPSNFEIIKLDCPFEFLIIGLNERVGVTSFCTSALLNSRFLSPHRNISYIYLKEVNDIKDADYKNAILDTYEGFEENNIRKVSLEI